jgi:hypothetical protein
MYCLHRQGLRVSKVCSAYSLTLTTEAVRSSVTLMNCNQTTRTLIVEDGTFIVTAVRTPILTYKVKSQYKLYVIFSIVYPIYILSHTYSCFSEHNCFYNSLECVSCPENEFCLRESKSMKVQIDIFTVLIIN